MEHIVKLSERVSMGITKENRVKLQNDSQESKCVSLSDDELKCLLTYALARSAATEKTADGGQNVGPETRGKR